MVMFLSAFTHLQIEKNDFTPNKYDGGKFVKEKICKDQFWKLPKRVWFLYLMKCVGKQISPYQAAAFGMALMSDHFKCLSTQAISYVSEDLFL